MQLAQQIEQKTFLRGLCNWLAYFGDIQKDQYPRPQSNRLFRRPPANLWILIPATKAQKIGVAVMQIESAFPQIDIADKFQQIRLHY
jgi:hypothetical protein